jgi:beta-fructofuranosidase
MIGWMQDPKNGNFADAQVGLSRPGLLYAVPMDYPDGYAHGAEGSGIFGQMTVPRELSYRDGKLYQWPVRELREYRKDKLEYNKVLIRDEERRFDGISGRALELDVEIAPSGEGAPLYREFTIEFAKDKDHFIRLSYKPARSLISIDRSHSGQCSEITARRSYRAAYLDGKLSLRILIDKWSAEVFVNGGEQAMSLTYYTPAEAEDITFSVDGSVNLNITAYTIRRDK